MGEIDSGGLFGDELGAESAGLLSKAHHQFGSHDALGEAGEVFDLGCQHQLTPRLIAGATWFAFDD